MRVFDPDRIAEHQKTIKENLRHLDAARGRSENDFLNDKEIFLMEIDAVVEKQRQEKKGRKK